MTKVLLISGPGGYAFNNANVQKMAQAMSNAGADVAVIGDGEKPIAKSQIDDAILDASKSGEPVTLFVMAHGDVKNGSHAIDIDGKYGLTSAQLFDSASKIGRPVDVFMTCCHGGAAITEVNKLPKGSTLATLAPGSETVSGIDVDRLTDVIETGDLSARHLTDLYLGKALKNRIAPSIAISGEGVSDLPREFIARIGKPFTESEKASVHTQLDSIIGSERADQIMAKMSTARDEWGIPALDFGASLAVTLAATSRLQELSSYNPNRGSHSGADLKPTWATRTMAFYGEDVFRGGKRTEPKPREGGWTDNT
jgi:hypothetical protein